MRKQTNYIVIHCTATPQSVSVEGILRYWRNVFGWRNVGYHFLIKADGAIHQLAPLDAVTNGVRGFNSESVHVSYIGGLEVDDRTDAQKQAISTLVDLLKAKYPTAKVQGHRDFKGVAKACPRFNAIEEYG